MPAVFESLTGPPSGYVAVPIIEGQEHAPLRICALMRPAEDPVAGHWVVLRDLADARVVLGAIADTEGILHGYVEIWVQNVDRIRATAAAHRFMMTNRALDERWASRHRCLLAADPSSIITTGFEQRHPTAVQIDRASLRPLAIGAQGARWRLCENDDLLRDAGLPPYSTSLDRYLYQPELGVQGGFIPVTAQSPTNDSTLPLTQHMSPNSVPFNVGAGLLMVRDYAPLGYSEFLEFMQAGSWEGVRHGQSIVRPAPGLEVDDSALAQRMFLSRADRPARVAEMLYLRLCALAGAVASVRIAVAQTRRPLLNLTDESFRVSVCPPRAGLPLSWGMQVKLVDLGDAIPLNAEFSELQYYLRGVVGGTSIFRPSASEDALGHGTFRIRQVFTEKRGIVVEGTFRPTEALLASRNDLLRVRLAVAAGRVDLYTRLQPDMALAEGEWRLRSIPQSLPEVAVTQLRAAEGIPFKSAEYEYIPLLSTPCDLYALAVLAVQTLLVKAGSTVSVALDDMSSLAREVARQYDKSISLPARISVILGQDARWHQSLGPGRWGGEQISPEVASACIPQELWCDVLAAIVRMFPGLGPDSACADLGDAPPNAIHRVFDPLLAELDTLTSKVVGLITPDWRFNREIRGIIRRILAPSAESRPPEQRRAGVANAPARAHPAATARVPQS